MNGSCFLIDTFDGACVVSRINSRQVGDDCALQRLQGKGPGNMGGDFGSELPDLHPDFELLVVKNSKLRFAPRCSREALLGTSIQKLI